VTAPGEHDHLSLTGLDEKQRADLDASVESRRALSKIAAAQPRRVDELLPLTDVVHVDSRPWRRARASGTAPASLIGAVRRGRRLRIEYDSPRESCPRDLVVDPYGLLAKAGIWYLAADCARVPRMYRLERITTWKEVDQPRRIRESQTLATVPVTDVLTRNNWFVLWAGPGLPSPSALTPFVPSDSQRASQRGASSSINSARCWRERPQKAGCDMAARARLMFTPREPARPVSCHGPPRREVRPDRGAGAARWDAPL
jgi:hypothetical protein